MAWGQEWPGAREGLGPRQGEPEGLDSALTQREESGSQKGLSPEEGLSATPLVLSQAKNFKGWNLHPFPCEFWLLAPPDLSPGSLEAPSHFSSRASSHNRGRRKNPFRANLGPFSPQTNEN